MNYAELYCQSNFSFLQGASHPEELVCEAASLGYEALAITDECSVAGIVRAYTAIKEQNLDIKLICGSLLNLDESLSVILICPNRKAYAELCRVISNARKRSVKGVYKLEKWDLMSTKECFCIWLPKGSEQDLSWARWLGKYYKDRLWIGITRYLNNNESSYVQHCETLANNFNLNLCACGGVLMHSAQRLAMQHTLTAIKLRTTVAKCGFKRLSNTERAMRSLNKLQYIFKQNWIENSTSIARLCQFNLASLRYEYPAELTPKGITPASYLRRLVAEGAKQRFPQGIPKEINEIIEKELKLICELNYEYFFLTIHDIVLFAKEKNILYQGRGSAANSIVCYCLDITAVNPTRISVLFERFISKERNEPPDIDVDFEHERREEVIQYIYQKYGRERTALAATVISFRLKMAIREVGKALSFPEDRLDYFIKNLHFRDKLSNWKQQIVELGLDEHKLESRHLFKLVDEILGFPRHLSQHVGGFVISNGPLYELVPIENAAMENRTVIQWDKDDLESLGLLKVDILALGMLTAIRKAFTLIQNYYGRMLSLATITKIDDDPDVYKMIQQADTVGVFQIESRAQMSMLPRLKPSCYYDLVIQIAIVRPGPIQGDMVHPFLKRKHGLEHIDYPSQEVQNILSRTLGVPIFQEQVIKLAMVAAGFSGGEADQLRRAMASWKKNGQLEPFKHKLISGMQSRGYDLDFAERLYRQICGFGGYGFPESHSASFAILAYISAWLKYHYPLAFYTALLNSLPMGFYSASQLIQDAKRHHVAVLPVCINQSNKDHCIEKDALRLGFRQVKGLSDSGIKRIVQKRPISGFTHMGEIKQLRLSKSDIESLASANAFHVISGNRFQSRWDMNNTEHSYPLLNLEIQGHETLSPPSRFENLIEDYHATGLSLNEHPIALLCEQGKLNDITVMQQLKNKPHKSLVTVAGAVTGKQAPGTASGVTFLTLEDHTGNINVVVWAGTAREQRKPFIAAKLLKVKGIVERQGNVIHVMAGKLIDITQDFADLQLRSREFH